MSFAQRAPRDQHGRRCAHWVGSLATLLLCLAIVAPQADAALEAGIAKRDITPQTPQRMSGYFSERISTGTHDPLWAKAVYFREGDTEAAVLVCDLLGVSEEITARIREAAATATGIPADHIAVAATHTHTGPLYYGVFRDLFHRQALAERGKDPHDPAPFVEHLIAQAAQAVAEAKAAARPVTLRHGTAEQHGLSFNRRFYMRDGTVRFNPGKLNPDALAEAGPIDPEVGMVMLEPADDAGPALLYTFALHLDTVGGTEFGGDYPYHVRTILREAVHPGLTTVFGIAPCGDVNHVDVTHRAPQKGHGEAQRIGRTLASTIQNALPHLDAAPVTGLAVARAVVKAPRQEFGNEDLTWAADVLARVADPAIPFLDKVRARAIVDLDARYPDHVPLEVQVFRLGPEVALVFLPGEIFVESGLHLKRASPFPTTLIFTLANGAPAYIPTAQAFEEGSYETVNTRVQPGAAEVLIETARRLLYGLAFPQQD